MGKCNDHGGRFGRRAEMPHSVLGAVCEHILSFYIYSTAFCNSPSPSDASELRPSFNNVYNLLHCSSSSLTASSHSFAPQFQPRTLSRSRLFVIISRERAPSTLTALKDLSYRSPVCLKLGLPFTTLHDRHDNRRRKRFA